MYIIGPSYTRAALHDVVQAAEERGVHREPDAAKENERKHTWLPSMPVLHLAVVMSGIVEGFEKGTPFDQMMYDLHARPEWLQGALLGAEGLRMVLHECIPGGEFDPDKAVRILPSESLPSIKS